MRKQNSNFRFLSLILVAILLAAMLFATVSCDNNSDVTTNDESTTEAPVTKTNLTFEVVFADGTTQNFNIQTDKKTVGEALLEKGLISGDNGPYGLYVKTVCGATHDYDTDGTYWSFYINDEMAMTGVDSTNIVDGTKYSFKVEK